MGRAPVYILVCAVIGFSVGLAIGFAKGGDASEQPPVDEASIAVDFEQVTVRPTVVATTAAGAPASSPPAAATIAPGATAAAPTATRPAASTTPAASVTPAAGTTPAAANYTVKSGDTLFVIAQANKTTIQAIVDLNKLASPDAIQAGQVLLLPPPAP